MVMIPKRFSSVKFNPVARRSSACNSSRLNPRMTPSTMIWVNDSPRDRHAPAALQRSLSGKKTPLCGYARVTGRAAV